MFIITRSDYRPGSWCLYCPVCKFKWTDQGMEYLLKHVANRRHEWDEQEIEKLVQKRDILNKVMRYGKQ